MLGNLLQADGYELYSCDRKMQRQYCTSYNSCNTQQLSSDVDVEKIKRAVHAQLGIPFMAEDLMEAKHHRPCTIRYTKYMFTVSRQVLDEIIV